ERAVRAPQRGRQQRQRLRKRAVLGRDRAGGRVRVADQRGQVVALGGDRRDRARGGDQKAGQVALVRGRLVDQPARAREQRVEVLRRVRGLLRLALVLRREPLDQALEVPARLRVQRVEELIKVDRGGRLRRVQRRAVAERRVRPRPGRE